MSVFTSCRGGNSLSGLMFFFKSDGIWSQLRWDLLVMTCGSQVTLRSSSPRSRIKPRLPVLEAQSLGHLDLQGSPSATFDFRVLYPLVETRGARIGTRSENFMT